MMRPIATALNLSFRRYHVLLLMLVFMMSWIVGCSTDSGPATTPVYGGLAGRVILYDGTGNRLSNSKGVVIGVVGNSASSTSDDSGNWTLSGLTPGSYDLVLAKPGLGTMKLYAQHVMADHTMKIADVVLSLAPASVVGVTDFQVYGDPSSDSIVVALNGNTSRESWRTLIVCLSPDSAALAADPSLAPWTFPVTVIGSGYDGTFDCSSDSVINLKRDSMLHNTTLYATICVASEGENRTVFSSYYDPLANRQVYSALGPHSKIVSAMVP